MESKFLVDAMLGKVARWLLLLGLDAVYGGKGGESDQELLEQARREGRVFVTRDTNIPPVAGVKVIVLRQARFADQLKQVLSESGIRADRKRLFSRCTVCNKPLDRLSREKALPLVPEKVRGLETDFFQCSSCSRVYWNGTHTERTVEKLRRMKL